MNAFEQIDKTFLSESLIIHTLEKVSEQYHIKHIPITRDLKSCLGSYTKEKLMKLSDDNRFGARQKWKKAELVQFIYDKIMNTLDLRLLIFGKNKLELFQKFLEDELQEEHEAIGELVYTLDIYPAAVRMGLIFPWRDENQITNVVPGMVRTRLDHVFENYIQLEEQYADELRFITQLNDLLRAGIHLYGVMTSSAVHELWEIQYPNEQLSVDQIREFMNETSLYLPLLVIKNGYHHVDNALIASEKFADEEEVQRFDANLPSRMEITPYKPSKQEIDYYKEHSFDRRTPHYKKLKQFLLKHHTDTTTDRMMKEIETNIQLGHNVSNVVDNLEQNNLPQFNTQNQFDHFIEMYVELHNHSRLWELFANTPKALYGRLRKMEEQRENPNKKVGRNDPCPCGSGKKYKKCCLKKNK